MRIIITGGTGLIGRALSAELAGAGYDVVVLSRSPGRSGPLPAGVRSERWDAHTTSGWSHLADGAAAIINLAGDNIGDGRWSAGRKEAIRSSRVRAGQAVTAAVTAATQKPGVVIQASAVGYYGPQGEDLLTEAAPPGSDFLARVCREWEASTAPVEALGVRRVIIRTGIVLTARGGVLPRMLLPFRFFAGGPLGSGQQGFPWIHMADEVGAIRFLMEHATASGPFNLTAPHPLTNATFSRTLGRVMKRPAVLPAPAVALRLLLGEMATLVLDGQMAVPQRLSEAGYRFRFREAEPALTDILRNNARHAV